MTASSSTGTHHATDMPARVTLAVPKSIGSSPLTPSPANVTAASISPPPASAIGGSGVGEAWPDSRKNDARPKAASSPQATPMPSMRTPPNTSSTRTRPTTARTMPTRVGAWGIRRAT